MTDWATSTVPVVFSTILEALNADSNLSGVQILDQDAGEADKENICFTGNVRWANDAWVDLGAQRRQEEYTLDAFVLVKIPEGGDVPTCSTRAFFLMGEIGRCVRDSIQQGAATLSGPLNAAFGQNAAQVTNIGLVPTRGIGGASGTGHFFQLDFGVRVVARF